MIKFYTIDCPKCKVLEIKLTKANLPYEVERDKAKVLEVGREHNVLSAPILQVDDKFLNFSDAIKYLQEVTK